jgi:hypothetical protein
MRKRNHSVLGLFAIALALVTAAPMRSAPAAEEPKPDQLAQEPPVKVSETSVTKVGADRELVFEEGDPRFKFVMHFDPNRELPRQRFAAQVQLTFKHPRLQPGIPPEIIRVHPLTSSLTPPEILELFQWGGGMGLGGPSQPEWFRERVERIPEDSRPAADIVEELALSRDGWTTSMAVRNHSPMGMGGTPADAKDAQAVLVITVLAADRERLEEMIRAVILVIDEGFSTSCHEAYVATEKRVQKWSEEQTQALRKHVQQHAAMQKEWDQLSSYDDLTSDSLATLVAHKRIIAVDLAGVEARLETCRKILVALRHNPKAAQVETVRIEAEIELAGLTAKHEAIDEIITAGRRRSDLSKALGRGSREFGTLERNQERAASVLDEYHRAVAGNWAYAEVGRVTVSDIRWLPATKEHPAGAVSAGHFEQER